MQREWRKQVGEKWAFMTSQRRKGKNLSKRWNKKTCLEKVVSALKMWENRELVEKVLNEILDVPKRYEKFNTKSYTGTKE